MALLGGVQAEVRVGLVLADDDDLVVAGGGDLQGQNAVVLEHDHAFIDFLVDHSDALGGVVVDAPGGLVGHALVGSGRPVIVLVELACGDTGGHQTVDGNVDAVLGEARAPAFCSTVVSLAPVRGLV